jgi:hypothetical protein
MKLTKMFLASPAKLSLGTQDFAILDVYRSLGAQSACAADVYLQLQKTLGRDPRLPTVYKVVTKLRDLGLLTDVGEAPSHGGRPRRMFQLTAAGRNALDLADQMAANAAKVGAMSPA